ncbi:TPA: hypothetical protein QDZ42_001363 [Stenotrophomonas maltophilia]|nr:hypothetical protein [Stenotrophomonas maltophilia]HDS1042724.1 hypothetical protein [Stenotrophomonas maltophilia]
MTALRRCIPLVAAIVAATAPVFAGDHATNPATRRYAETMQISMSEAAQRMAAEKAAGELNARLQQEKPGTFAGLYIEHTPEFRIVVRFTGDASKQLSAYTRDRLYVAGTAPRSLELLRATQQTVADQLNNADMDFVTTVDVRNSLVDVYVLDPESARVKLSEPLSALSFIRIKETTGFVQLTHGMLGGGAPGR